MTGNQELLTMIVDNYVQIPIETPLSIYVDISLNSSLYIIYVYI